MSAGIAAVTVLVMCPNCGARWDSNYSLSMTLDCNNCGANCIS